MIGETIGRFELRSRLGEGPFGEVWLAGHREAQHPVAIKLLHPAVSALPAIPAFVAAAREIARISNAFVAKVYDAGIAGDGRAYVVSELVLGQSLGQRMAQGRSSQTQVADVVAQIARALIAAQGVSVVHHDLKPSNVILVPDPDRAAGERVVVLDFGLAPLVPAGLERAAPAFVAPELWTRGEVPADGAADMYSLGCLAFQMAVGRPPFLAPSYVKMRERHLHDPAPTIRSQMPDIGAVMDKLVARMLEKQPADRLRSMKEVAKLFDLLVGQEAPLGETVRDS
jgi:serine/threonine protein kinase